jgi:ribulose-phosphate 3-epimerase
MLGQRPRHLEVDGGLNAATVPLVAESGANVMVAGSGVVKGGTYAENIAAIRDNAERARAAA